MQEEWTGLFWTSLILFYALKLQRWAVADLCAGIGEWRKFGEPGV